MHNDMLILSQKMTLHQVCQWLALPYQVFLSVKMHGGAGPVAPVMMICY